MERCGHGVDPAWCCLCRIEASGVDPHVAWGLDDEDGPSVEDYENFTEPMWRARIRYLRFLERSSASRSTTP